MAFQPLGYRFEVKSPASPSDVKAAIRSRKTGWFDPKSGARGWIVGPFICLWFSAFDRSGPMLFGSISHDGLGTRVRGRAGSDLNGVLMFSLLMPLLLLLTILMVSDGSTSPRQALVFAVLLLVGGPIVFWSAHQDRRHAEPLVRFLRNALGEPKRRARQPTSPQMGADSRLILTINGVQQDGLATEEAVHEALLATGVDDSVVLAADDELYIQTLGRDGGFILETRQGNRDRHFIAARPGDTQTENGSVFTFEEATAAFASFASRGPPPPFLQWQLLTLPAPSQSRYSHKEGLAD